MRVMVEKAGVGDQVLFSDFFVKKNHPKEFALGCSHHSHLISST